MSLIELIVLTLATWRLSSLLANESGPGGMLERLRRVLGVCTNDLGERTGKNALADEVLCQWCNSIWIGALWMGFYLWAPRAAFYAALPFALSTGTILILTSKGLQVFLRHLGER